MNGNLWYLGATALIGWAVVAYLGRQRAATRRARELRARAAASGLGEPLSLHPSVDPNRCISIGACVTACPEGDILGIVNGRAELIAPTRCIGHGACAAACPVDAITLVFGTQRRGVDIPYVRETFETNVPGVYIAGELGGMGLIRNAVTQGREAVENLAHNRSRDPAVADVVIVGAGPAGLAATLRAEEMGLRYVTVEQDDIGGTMLSYPRHKLVMTQPMVIPLYGTFDRREARKEELVALWAEVIARTGIHIHTGEKLESVRRPNGSFEVVTSRRTIRGRNILLAVGRRGTPRKLGVPGEERAKVAYKLLEPEQYRGRRVLVVGGGDSAVEAALALAAEPGTEVALSYRRDAFARIKDANRERIERAAAAGEVEVLFGSQVREIGESTVTIESAGGRGERANDYVIVLIGGEMPTELLRSVGVSIEKKFGTR